MLFLLLLIIGAVIFFLRYFIINSLKNPQQRTKTFYAALKAVYFLPVFQQALFMFCMGLIYFYAVSKGFFLLLQYGISSDREPDQLQFFYVIAFLGASALVLCCLFILAKKSMNTKWDAVNVLYKIAYLLFSIGVEALLVFNLPLLYPALFDSKSIIFYGNSFIITITAIVSLIIFVLPFVYTVPGKLFRYFQLAVLTMLLYVILAFMAGAIVFLLFEIVKLLA